MDQFDRGFGQRANEREAKRRWRRRDRMGSGGGRPPSHHRQTLETPEDVDSARSLRHRGLVVVALVALVVLLIMALLLGLGPSA